MSTAEFVFRLIIFTAAASCYLLFAAYKMMTDNKIDLLKEEIMQLRSELRKLERRWS